MDIFDAVTTWLKTQKDSGSDRIYLSQSSKDQLSVFLELSRDENKLNRWLDENQRSVREVSEVKSVPVDLAINPTKEPQTAVFEKPVSQNAKIMANKPEIVQPLPDLSVNEPIEPISSTVTSPVLPEKNIPTQNVLDASDYLILKNLAKQTKILIIGEQLHHPQSTEPFEKSKTLLQKMINAMDNFVKKTIPQPFDIAWETISLVEVCKKNYMDQDHLGYIQKQLKQIIEETAPSVILSMGSLPTEALTGEKRSILNIHGQWFSFQSVPCMPTFHPDFLNRVESRKKEAWADLQKVIKLLSDRRI